MGCLKFQAEIKPNEPVRVIPERDVQNDKQKFNPIDIMKRLMARTLILFFILTTSAALNAQFYIIGRCLDEEEQPYAFAKAELRGEDIFREQICTELGVFRFEDLKSGSYELVVITPYGIRRKKIELRGSIDVTLHVPRNVEIDEISVVAKRASTNEPVTHDNINKEELQQADTGQDMPYLLENTPSVVVTSDAGHGIGYTGMRIRGIDPTRINVTLNGIPVNDAESHSVFWVDLPDIAGSTANVQIQRGLGWSQPGVGDLGAGIHLNTLSFNHEPYAGLILGTGSFQTRRISGHAGSGLINGRFTIDARGTYIFSEGFIDRAESKLYSIYGSAGYHHDQTNIRFVYAFGDELTYQAWNGVPEQYIEDENLRTFNSAGIEKSLTDPHDNEVDDYSQSYYQLHVDQALTPFARWSTSLHYTRGKGFFEQYKAAQFLPEYGFDTLAGTSDLIRRRWLDNHFYGFTSTLQIGRALQRYLVVGGGWNKYLGDHFGTVIWTEADEFLLTPHNYYFNDAVKTDWNIFGRNSIKLTDDLNATIDLQARWIRYMFEGPDTSAVPGEQFVRHRFFNPKVGFDLELSEKLSLYALTGIMHKEPNRDDYVHSTPLSRPSPERLWDTELGLRFGDGRSQVEITGFWMDYHDHLVPTGRLNDVGAYTRVNVKNSYRAGIETRASFKPVDIFTVSGQATISKNKIKEFDEYIDNWDTGLQEIVHHSGTHIALSPGVIASLQGDLELFEGADHKLSFSLTGKYVGKQYADNTSRSASLLDEYLVGDAALYWTWNSSWAEEVRLSFFVKNLFDTKYESNGWIYRFRSESYDPVPDDPYAGQESGSLYHLRGYYPQAGRHFFVTLGVSF